MKIHLLLLVNFLLLKLISCESVQISNINIDWTNRGTQTDFVISSSLDSGLSLNNAWLGFGFNPRMVKLKMKKKCFLAYKHCT